MREERVFIDPEHPERKEKARIGYHGLLAKAGADRLFLHYGFDGWQNPRTVSMSPYLDGFTATVPVEGLQELNFCFKDSAGNWDNNSGWNWKAQID